MARNERTRTGDDNMKNTIVRTKDGRVYHCKDCPYSNRETRFCGFCMRKILDETRGKKKGDGNEIKSPAENKTTKSTRAMKGAV